jgi:hypothetical protein
VAVLENFKTTEAMTLEQARRALGIPDRIFEQELRHHRLVAEIVGDARRPGRSGRSLKRAGPR